MGAGLNFTLRDLARAGEMIRRGGMYNGQQFVATKIIDEIRKGGDRGDFSERGHTSIWIARIFGLTSSLE
jgi:hypothetical protein